MRKYILTWTRCTQMCFYLFIAEGHGIYASAWLQEHTVQKRVSVLFNSWKTWHIFSQIQAYLNKLYKTMIPLLTAGRHDIFASTCLLERTVQKRLSLRFNSWKTWHIFANTWVLEHTEQKCVSTFNSWETLSFVSKCVLEHTVRTMFLPVPLTAGIKGIFGTVISYSEQISSSLQQN